MLTSRSAFWIGQVRFLQGAAERGLANLAQVAFIQADLSEFKHWEHADVVYVASLCFSDGLMLALVEAATALKDGTAVLSPLAPAPPFAKPLLNTLPGGSRHALCPRQTVTSRFLSRFLGTELHQSSVSTAVDEICFPLAFLPFTPFSQGH